MKSNLYTDIDRQADYYNQRWKDSTYAGRLKLSRSIAILQAVASTGLSTPRMCDLGCGTGWLTTILGNFGPTIGVDLSDEAVLAASKRYPNADFVHANVLDWHGPSQMFDIVVSQEVIEHVEDQDGYLGIAANLLKSSGFLILTTPNLDAVKALPKPNRSTQPIENWLDRVKLRGLAERHFTDVRITTIIPARSQSVIARLIGSGRLRSILRSVRLYPLWEHLTLRWGLGLHFLLIARKR